MEPVPEFPAHRVIRQIGEGANSRVFLGESLVDSSLKALKVYASRSDQINRFAAELHTLTHVVHPHIVTLFEFGSTLDGTHDYLGLEYLDGKDFVSGSRDLSQDDFLTLIVQALSALELLHRRGFSHGDLTPSHLVLTRSPCSSPSAATVKLIDFGASQSSGIRTIEFKEGTLGYVAPEVLRGGRPNPASDLYSFGTILSV